MMLRHVIVDVLLWLGVGLNLIAAIGVLAMSNVYDRLHFSGVSALGAVCVAVAVVVEKSFSLMGDESLVAAAILLVGSPVLTHATARAARISERGEWRLQEGEGVEVEKP
jgi:monovalent cation/proton antiporter MnhG/PhaG subunit